MKKISKTISSHLKKNKKKQEKVIAPQKEFSEKKEGCNGELDGKDYSPYLTAIIFIILLVIFKNLLCLSQEY